MPKVVLVMVCEECGSAGSGIEQKPHTACIFLMLWVCGCGLDR